MQWFWEGWQVFQDCISNIIRSTSFICLKLGLYLLDFSFVNVYSVKFSFFVRVLHFNCVTFEENTGEEVVEVFAFLAIFSCLVVLVRHCFRVSIAFKDRLEILLQIRESPPSEDFVFEVRLILFQLISQFPLYFFNLDQSAMIWVFSFPIQSRYDFYEMGGFLFLSFYSYWFCEL